LALTTAPSRLRSVLARPVRGDTTVSGISTNVQ
jgi:hypothetical protein